MQAVLDHIESRRLAYVDLPLFQHLRNPGSDPAGALMFMRNAAHFIMSFADLNKYCWRDEANGADWQEKVNAHTHEDDHHWPWYLSDLIALGMDEKLTLTEALQFLWSDANKETRLLSYRLWSMSENASALDRMIIIEAIEATGVVFFGDLVSCAHKIPEGRLTRPLIYVADHHFGVEQGHSAGQATHDARLSDIKLDAAEQARYLAMVDKVFDLFIGWSAELYKHALQGPMALEMDAQREPTRASA